MRVQIIFLCSPLLYDARVPSTWIPDVREAAAKVKSLHVEDPALLQSRISPAFPHCQSLTFSPPNSLSIIMTKLKAFNILSLKQTVSF